MEHLHIFGLLLSVALVSSAPVVGNDIIGGTEAADGQWPWQVYLVAYNPTTGRAMSCGGSLLSKRHIVTAAHCTYGVEPQNTRTMLGSIQLYDNTENNPFVIYLDARRTWIHPEYRDGDPSLRNDISIIELSTDVEFNDYIQPIKVRRNDTELLELAAVVTGWGLTSLTTGTLDLMQTRVPFIDHSYCRSRWLEMSKNQATIDDTQVCAGSYHHGTAPGDSGGPLVVYAPNNQWYLVGLTSFGDNSATGLNDQYTYPGVYLRLSKYCDDINIQRYNWSQWLGQVEYPRLYLLCARDLKPKPRGITKATVTITFDNTNPDLRPLGYEGCKEIVIRRQVVVNGRNNYTINGFPATNQRAADLFRSVGLNINNPHFLIMQGRITKVLNMKPMEILGMIEEAAGVRLLDAKKMNCQKTIDKKEATMAEIHRVMTQDIEPKINMLKDDKANYLEYERLTRDNEILQRKVIAAEFLQCEESQRAYLEKKEPLLEEINQLQTDIQTNRGRIEEISAQRQELEEERTKMQQQILSDLQSKVQETAKHYTTMQAENKDKSDYVKAMETAIMRKRKDIDSDRTYLEKRKAELQKLESSFGDEEQRGKEAEEAVNLARKKIETLAKGMMLNDVGQAVTLEGQLTATRSAISEANTKIKMTEMRLKQIEPTLKKKQAELKDFAEDERRGNEELIKLEKKMADAQKSIENISYTEGTWERIDEERRQLMDQKRKMLREHDDLANKYERFLAPNYKNPQRNFDRTLVKGTIAANIRIKEHKYMVALEVVAGGALGNIIVQHPHVGRDLLHNKCFNQRVTFIPLEQLTFSELSEEKIKFAKELVGDDNVQPALELLDYDPVLTPAIKKIFANTFVCSTMDSANKLAFHPQLMTRCVTLGGEDYRSTGQLTGGARSARSTVLPGIANYRDLKERLNGIDAQCQQVDVQLREAATEQKKFSQAKEVLTTVQSRLESLQERLQTSRVQMLRNDIEQLEQEIPLCRQECDEAKSRIAELKEKVKDLELNKKNEKEYREKQKKIAQKELQDAEKAFTKMRDAYEDAQNQLSIVRGEIEQLGGELAASDTELAKMDEQLIDSRADFEQFAQELDEAKKSEAAARQEHEVVLLGVREMEAKLRRITKEADSLQKSTFELGQKKEALEDEVKDMLHQADQWGKRGVALERKHTWITEDKALFGRAETPYDFEGLSYRELREDYDRRQDRIECLRKIVKPSSMQTLNMAEEQHAMLQKQVDAIRRDREKLRKALETMDTRKENEILRAHRQVNKDFGEIYKSLLPGAEAKLEPPMGYKNALGGLEVKVGFNGKWKESLQELSGGQRSLIALALVLAMLKFSPAPLYILDEVDAALDISHTQNIGHMIKEHFSQSQFVVVSLKEGMFNHANVLFRTKFVDGTSTVARTTNIDR
ncbi:hypothetical protein QR680_000282 [Steinernema hermaphroditum]|uniref:Peptidase S1 domain-containing protein n=1 Tax=Steinernema hermaphroditum TaxID=289476 RepID=A0AA39LDU6_9BILA|nr:hypothetical protein QR680_000282 [Steinernema hermaphroditum]